MLVSVVLAVHNGAASLDAAIASVRAQTFTDLELIVVDDRSTDRTPEIVARHAAADPRVVAVAAGRRLGLAGALNLGWRRARGELIARLDADDECLPTRLERQVACLAAHPEIDVLGTGAILVDDEGREIARAVRPPDHDTLVGDIFRASPFMHPTVMMRRSFLEALGGYDETLGRAQDFDLWLRGRSRFRYANLPDPLVRYRVRARPLVGQILWGSYVLARGAWREGRFLRDGRYAARYFAATVLGRFGLRDTRQR
jgi:glycosyltransferase involved in cell wall biosynthesis